MRQVFLIPLKNENSITLNKEKLYNTHSRPHHLSTVPVKGVHKIIKISLKIKLIRAITSARV